MPVAPRLAQLVFAPRVRVDHDLEELVVRVPVHRLGLVARARGQVRAALGGVARGLVDLAAFVGFLVVEVEAPGGGQRGEGEDGGGEEGCGLHGVLFCWGISG